MAVADVVYFLSAGTSSYVQAIGKFMVDWASKVGCVSAPHLFANVACPKQLIHDMRAGLTLACSLRIASFRHA